ncbi:MAG: hypothetical protein BroJett018_47040 [Chloroflexota bacterium]|nr:hypothetical protein [Chloroflexota bacterium]NOG64334.1 hypothetical protein [Chloroflexota bacterium]GIK66910.1 MAG: hypothetical protein BroJett018_47040 [Chloroflexota bacterium]
MSYVIPSTARYTLDDGADTLKFSIPAKKHWASLPIMSIWLIFWAVAEIGVGGGLIAGLIGILTGDVNPANGVCPGLFMIVWFTIWTLGGTSVLLSVLWQFMGVETIRVNQDDLWVRRQILGVGRSKLYDVQYIHALRVVPSEPYLFRRRQNPYPQWFFNSGTLAFDYGAKTYRIGSDLEEAEAREILASIQSRFPQYTN